jgi:hypothetical protein
MRSYLLHVLIISFIFLLMPNVQAELHHSEYPSGSILPPHIFLIFGGIALVVWLTYKYLNWWK